MIAPVPAKRKVGREPPTDPSESAEAPTTKYAVPALDKALDVIELLAEEPSPLSQTDIAQRLDRKLTEIFRTLAALEARGYLRRTGGGRYRLTLRLFELGRMHNPFEELLRVAKPAMSALSEETGESCHLTALQNGEVVVLAQHESPNPMRLSIAVGSRHPPLGTTSGRVILASMPEEERAAFLAGYTGFDGWKRAERAAFLGRLEGIARRGHAVSDGERFVGGLDIGVPIGTDRSTVRAALILATLRRADRAPDLDALVAAVRRTGERIARAAGLSVP